MTLTILLVGLAVVLAATLWRFARRRGAAPAALILLAVPLAAIPAIAGVTSGAWQLRYAFERIAVTGSGGVGAIAIVAQDAVRSVAMGVAVFVAFLVVATILALWSGSRTAAGVNRPRVKVATSGFLALLVVAAIGLTAVSVVAAEWASAGSVVRFAARITEAPPPARYASVAQGSTADWVGDLERLSNATTSGGVALIALLAGAVWLISRSLARSGNVGLSPAVAAGIAAVTIGAAAVYLIQVQPTLAWLGDLVALTRA